MAEKTRYMLEFKNVLTYIQESKDPKTVVENINKTFLSTFEGVLFTVEELKQSPVDMAKRVHELYLIKLVVEKEIELPAANQYRKQALSFKPGDKNNEIPFPLPPIDMSSVKLLQELTEEPPVEDTKPEETPVEETPVDNTVMGIDPAVSGSDKTVITEITTENDQITGVSEKTVGGELIDINLISIPELLIRKQDDPELTEFIESISQLSMIEPIVVRPVENGNTPFELVVGSRRLQAAKHLGWDSIPAVIQVYSDLEALEVQGAENFQRREFTTWELLDFISACMERGLKQKEICRLTHMQESNLSTMAKALKVIPEDILESLRNSQPEITRQALGEIANLDETEQRELLTVGEEHEIKAADLKKKKEKSKPAASTPEPDLTDDVQEYGGLEDSDEFDETTLNITAQEFLTELLKIGDYELSQNTKNRLVTIQEKIVEVLNA